MKFGLVLLLLCLSSCWIERSQDKTVREKQEVEARLKKQLSPVIENYFKYCRDLDMNKIFAMYSSQLQTEYNKMGLKKLMENQKNILEQLGKTAVVKSVKPHGQVFAIVSIDSFRGEEFWGMINERGDWKIHRTSKNLVSLLTNLQ